MAWLLFTPLKVNSACCVSGYATDPDKNTAGFYSLENSAHLCVQSQRALGKQVWGGDYHDNGPLTQNTSVNTSADTDRLATLIRKKQSGCMHAVAKC